MIRLADEIPSWVQLSSLDRWNITSEIMKIERLERIATAQEELLKFQRGDFLKPKS